MIPSRVEVMQGSVKSYLGTPYRMGGSSHDGIDCSGLVMRVYQTIGIDLPRSTWEQMGGGKRVRLHEIRFGDVLFFKNPGKGERGVSLHAGIFTGDGRFVHASKSRGVVMDSFSDDWRDLFLEARRFLE